MRAATATRAAPPTVEVVRLPGGVAVRTRGPRRLWLVAAVMIVAIAVCATIAGLSVTKRTNTLTELVARTEPLATAAENLYAALSQADAAAASAFLAGGTESASDRATYTQAVADAGVALGTAASGIDAASPVGTQAALTQLVTQLPVYTGLVDTARAENRLGLPVGAAYLREASSLMRTTLLPAAQTLYTQQSAVVTQAQDEAGGLPIAAMAMAVLVVLILLVGTLLLSTATRRRLNLGVLVALLATVGWLGWLVVAGAAAGKDLSVSRSAGSDPLNSLVAARIVAQQARTDEKLYLIARGSGAANEKDFTTHATQLTDLLGQVGSPDGVDPTALTQAATTWVNGHSTMFTTGDGGDYPGAVQLSTQTLDKQFLAVDQQLRAAVDTVRATLRDRAQAGNTALDGLTPGILGLAALSVLAVAVGILPRLREYQ